MEILVRRENVFNRMSGRKEVMHNCPGTANRVLFEKCVKLPPESQV
jgi:hypothetical protein